MKQRTFNKTLKEISGKNKLLDPSKIKGLDNDTRNEMIDYIVRKRLPIAVDFLNEKTDMEWLSAMGYMYYKKGIKFTFLCTEENSHKIRNKKPSVRA